MRLRPLAAIAVAALALLATVPRAAAEPATVSYRPPVDAPVVDTFRPSQTGYGAGNLGLDYATEPGTAVRAATAGEVVFAGAVAGALHVVVLHADGVRTSYSFLASTTVARGNRVAAGQTVGTAGTTVHFGARAGDAYIDPALLLAAGPPRVTLVPDWARQPASAAAERSRVEALVGWLGRTGRGAVGAVVDAGRPIAGAGADALAWARDTTGLAAQLALAELQDKLDLARLLLHYAQSVASPLWATGLVTTIRATLEWWHERDDCTSGSIAAPRLPHRRVVVEVGGLGSHQTRGQAGASGGAVFEVDTEAIWANAEVHRFSYAGGTTTDRGYTSRHTQVDIRRSGRRLRELLERIHTKDPGVEIDIVAHSQGGLVVRSALGDELDRTDPRTPHVASVVTLATPHHGANLATAGALLGRSSLGALGKAVAGELEIGGIDPRATSIEQMAETSSFIRELNRRPLPEDVRFTSIAARGDPIVPSPRSHLSGATNVIVDVPGVGTDHDRLPGSDVATREIALAVSGMGPTCESFFNAVGDALTGEAVSYAEDTLALIAAGAALTVDGAMPRRSIERNDP